MLSLNNLVVENKILHKEKQEKSLLAMLVKYLRGKFEKRMGRKGERDREDYNR
jgi:hypothetical protein